MLNLNDLRMFVRVVDHGGFTAASRALHVPKQTLSKRLAELERKAGVRLVERSSRSFRVTELGRALYRHAAAMVVEAEEAEHVIMGRLAEPSGTVRITASVPTAQQLLAPILPRIARQYPKIRIVLDVSDRFVDVIQEGYDIALRDHAAPLPDSELVQRRLRTEAFWLVAAPAYLKRRRPRTPADLEKMDGLFAVPAEPSWTLRDAHGTVATVTLPARYFANEATALKEAAIAGLGIARLPATLCRNALRAKGLVRVLPEWIAGEISTTLLMPGRRHRLPSVRVVADLLAETEAGGGNSSRRRP